jgi:acyl carrier protein
MPCCLREDLGLDSADTIELVFEIEETFDLEVPDDDQEKLKTVRELTNYVEEWLRRRPPPTAGKEP